MLLLSLPQAMFYHGDGVNTATVDLKLRITMSKDGGM
jgi:hypothetical protein